MTSSENKIELHEASKDVLEQAISLIYSDCFTAMLFARAFNGRKFSPEWYIVENNKATDIVKAAKQLGIVIEEIKPTIHLQKGITVKDTVLYKTLN